jgi:hypothetical protein
VGWQAWLVALVVSYCMESGGGACWESCMKGRVDYMVLRQRQTEVVLTCPLGAGV